ncbi:glutaredoxin family protein [Planomicrobium chinense]|uniref:glutaredoxin family protein n=1 Tax=Planococcus chinensis TaxID=272917 RepID=UPI001CC39FBC|nr:glutaredoxin family protein [Planococcus chinensis]MBZ5201663.1 glutaredoxin family protein [Planococcus chinensis]
MAQSPSIIVWSKQGCHYCAEVKEYLEANRLSYKTVDVTENDDRRDILEIKYGVRYVPVVEIGKDNVYKAVVELGIENLEEALEQAGALIKS